MKVFDHNVTKVTGKLKNPINFTVLVALFCHWPLPLEWCEEVFLVVQIGVLLFALVVTRCMVSIHDYAMNEGHIRNRSTKTFFEDILRRKDKI
jgi:hypothetical protein